MSNTLRVLSRLSALAVLSSSLQAQTQRSPVDTLHWLAGCWKLSAPALTVEEHWMAPSGGMMVGMSRTVMGGRAREHEFLRIYASHDTLVYAAIPSGQQPTEFRARSVSPSEIVFENLAHDFPQRIRYRRTSGDLVTATIEGDREGKRQPMNFAYRRAECVPH